MQTLEALNLQINNAFSELEFPSFPAELYDPITYTLALGGKRLRPLLVLAACDMFGGNINDAIHPAIGIELFHNFTLLHDDLMDQAPLRRGKETVYKKWNSNIAILAGDTMFALANRKMLRTKPGSIAEVVDLFNRTAVEVCEGQQYDMNFETQEYVSIDAYIEMIRLKTAVLLAASLKTGAIIAGADTRQLELIYTFGINIGLAFQLMDDLLDVYSTEEKFGKVSGGDIISGKKTFLYLKALELLGPDAGNFRLLYESQELAASEKVIAVKTIFDRLNIYSITRDEINEYWEKALEIMKSISCPKENKEPLLSYAAKLMERDY